MDRECCQNCQNIRGYSNTGYWCSLDKQEIDKYDYCKCYKDNEDQEVSIMTGDESCKYCKWYNRNEDTCDYGYDTEKYYNSGCDKYAE